MKHYKIEFRQESAVIIDADDEMQAENTFELQHNVEPDVFKRIIETTPVAINDKGQVFELKEIVKIVDPELEKAAKKDTTPMGRAIAAAQTYKYWTIAAINEDTVLCIQTDSNNKITSKQEVPQSVLRKVWE